MRERETADYRLVPGQARWDPCEPPEFLINPVNQPLGAVADLWLAMRKISEATGCG